MPLFVTPTTSNTPVSEVDICNLALSHIGDRAGVVSISPPTSAQETYCATFYPIARDLLLESHAWAFNTSRAALTTSSVTPPSTWQYAYVVPDNMLRLLAILDPNASDDYSTPVVFSTPDGFARPVTNVAVATPYDFAVEYDEASGARVIYTNMQSAVGRYTVWVSDTLLYPKELVMALSYQLAALLAGPILKGDVGTKVAAQMEQFAQKWLAKAMAHDADQRQAAPTFAPTWIANR